MPDVEAASDVEWEAASKQADAMEMPGNIARQLSANTSQHLLPN
jgi:hypothetical protein